MTQLSKEEVKILLDFYNNTELSTELLQQVYIIAQRYGPLEIKVSNSNVPNSDQCEHASPILKLHCEIKTMWSNTVAIISVTLDTITKTEYHVLYK